MSPPASDSFTALLYRYWFFGWLFRDVSRGNALERAAALRHNRGCARWLPTYMRRWTTLGLLLYGLGVALEQSGFGTMAGVVFVPACLAAPVLAVLLATWWLLRAPRSAWVDRP